MSINTNLPYLFFLKESGIDTFLQNEPNNLYNEKMVIKDNEKFPSKKNLTEIISLNELENYIQNTQVCDLKKYAKNTVFSDGNPSSKIMLIGEAPGAEEDRIGKPFVGLAGQLLDKMIQSIGLSRKTVYISNIIPWRPPNNRTPSTEEMLQCLPFVQKHIEIIKPKLLILLGGTAAKTILTTTEGITKLRGKWYNYNNLSLTKPILTRAVFHPAFLLRSPVHKREAWEDLKEIKQKYNNILNEAN